MSKQTDLINVTDAITVSGSNVGIGTSSPSAKLEVAGNVKLGAVNPMQTATNVVHGTSGQNGFSIRTAVSGATTPTYSNVDDPNTGMFFPVADTLGITTGGTERMRIDSSGNVLIGTTNANIYSTTTTGINLNPDGPTSFNRNGGQAAMFNRINSDGDIVQFRKDGTLVGSIQSRAGAVATIILDPRGNGSGLTGTTNGIIPTTQTGSPANNHVDLGTSGSNFRNAYLSGGVYLGGTGSANKLDDFEYGTWTPSLINAPSGISIAGTTIHNNYTKIGNFVFVTGYIELNTGSSSGNAIHIGGLPFSPRSVNAVAGSLINRYASSDTYAPFLGNSSQIEFYKINNTGNWNKLTYSNVGNPFSVHFTINYQT